MPAQPPGRGTRRSLHIGPYTVEAPLALGTLGSAYRATDLTAGRTVALKVLPPELAGSSAARERFQREARRARKVYSPHLVNVLDFGDAGGTWFLALELVEGPTLTEYVQRHGALDGDAVRDVLVQAARALALLHREGLVPHDLSADNFRVTSGPDPGGRVAVKLCDLGLLRPADEAADDVRTALGALGATAWFLLTGRTDAVPDLGSLAGDVPDEFRAVLRRLLARRPEERYPTAAALLEALGEEESSGTAEAVEPAPAAAAGLGPIAAQAVGGDEKPPQRKPVAPKKPLRRRDEARTEEKPSPRPREPEKDEKSTPEPATAGARSRKAILIGAAAFGGILVVGTVVAILALHTPDSPPMNPPLLGKIRPGGTTNKLSASSEKSGTPEPKKTPEPAKGPEAPPPAPPPLYVPQVPFDRAKVSQEFAGPAAAAPQVPADAPVFRVARVPAAASETGPVFDSVAAACAAVPEGKWGVVEIQDNGPLMEGPISVSGRNVALRAAPGFAPLIVWDTAQARTELRAAKPPAAPPKDDVTAFLSVDQGTLLLDNIHFAVAWPEHLPGSPCLVRVGAGDLIAVGSTFSAAGKPRGTFTAVRFEGGTGHACRLRQCCARGTGLMALDVVAGGADVTIDGSLLVGGNGPVLSVAGGKAPRLATTLRVVRSTLVGRDILLRVRPDPEAAAEPALHWLGWDVLLWRAAENAGGTMVDLPREAGPKAMTWQAVNCLYAGWETLLSGLEPLAGSDSDTWRARWGRTEGDVSQALGWAKGLPAEPAEALPSVYRSYPGPAGYAATSGPGVLGCDLGQLPPLRPRWIDVSTEKALAEVVAVLAPDAPPIPEATDQLYHGERLDLDTTDLGAYLHDVQKARKLAPTVVLHLRGTGRHKTSPVRVENASLFVYFEPPAEGAEPLVLEPDATVTTEGQALFEVTHGNLSMIGGDVRCPDFKTALLPPYVVMVKEGNLSLSATRLQGPLIQPPPTYAGLIRVEGTGSAERGTTHSASIDRCTLLSARVAVHLVRAGLRVNVRQSLVVCTDRAVAFQPDDAAHLNVEFTAEHTTFAAKEAVFSLPAAEAHSDSKIVSDPILVQTKDCAFLNPFADPDGKAAPAVLLAYRDGSLQRGVLCWQAEGTVYDRRLHA